MYNETNNKKINFLSKKYFIFLFFIRKNITIKPRKSSVINTPKT